MPAVRPSGLEAFADHVIRVLRRRGLFRTEDTGRTLREHDGIPRRDSQFAADRQAVPEPVAGAVPDPGHSPSQLKSRRS